MAIKRGREIVDDNDNDDGDDNDNGHGTHNIYRAISLARYAFYHSLPRTFAQFRFISVFCVCVCHRLQLQTLIPQRHTYRHTHERVQIPNTFDMYITWMGNNSNLK